MTEAKKISLAELREMSEKMFDPIVKAVVDVRLGVMSIDADLHSDLELFMLERGSAQNDLWGINLWPENYGNDAFVEFDSLINIRPYQGNRARGVDSPEIREKIRAIVGEAVRE
jgi:hypothetical protein